MARTAHRPSAIVAHLRPDAWASPAERLPTSHPTCDAETMNEPTRSSFNPAFLGVPAVVFLCWGIPRLVVSVFGVDGHWAPFFYQYLLGGLVFTVGLWVIRVSGACDWKNPRDRQWFRALVFGYFAYAAIHGITTWLAAAVPFKGAA